jgi:hypothetical protein
MFSFLAVAKLATITLACLGTLQQPAAPVASTSSEEPNAATLFENRIMPIFRSEKPSSCVQCHLSSVDLKNYILPSHEKTFVSLRDQGLIDLEDPRNSKILTLIKMGDQDKDDLSRRIHEKMRQAEYQAFASWVEACVHDKRIRELPPLESSELAKPDKPDEVIRHARKSRVVNSFVRNIWSQRMRCFPCHTPNEIQPNQKKAQENFDNWQAQYGDQMLIFKKTPEATIRHLIEASKNARPGDLPLINLKNPTESLLLVKPTSKLDGEIGSPTYSAPVYHMGGLKIHKDDQSYKSFAAWLKDYANVVDGEYESVEDLPADNWFATKRIIRMKDTPESWDVGTPVQLFIYAPGDRPAEWSQEPIAFTQGTVTPRKMVNGAIFLMAPTDAARFEQWKQNPSKLPPGKYLVKVFVDNKKRLADDPTLLLDEADFAGQVEIGNAQWQLGFPKAETISGTNLATN